MLSTAILVSVVVSSAAQTLPPEALAVTEADVFLALDLQRPGLEAVKAAVARGDLPQASAAWADYMQKREKPVLHFSRDTWAAVIRRDYPQLMPPILQEADAIARHRLQGATVSLPVQGDAIGWLSNPTKDYDYITIVGTYVPLTSLGRAYLLTGDEKYAKAFDPSGRWLRPPRVTQRSTSETAALPVRPEFFNASGGATIDPGPLPG